MKRWFREAVRCTALWALPVAFAGCSVGDLPHDPIDGSAGSGGSGGGRDAAADRTGTGGAPGDAAADRAADASLDGKDAGDARPSDASAADGDAAKPDAGAGDASLDGDAARDAADERDAAVPTWTTVRLGHDDGDAAVANFSPRSAVSANGDAMIVYYDDIQVWARRYVKATDSLDPLFQVNDASFHGVNPRVAMDDAGNAVVAWYGSSQSGDVVGVRQFSAASQTWGPIEVADPGQGASTFHVLAGLGMTPGGDAVVAWTLRTNGVNKAYFRVMNNPRTGRGWGSVEQFPGSNDAVGSAVIALAEVSQSLRIVTAWSQADLRGDSALDIVNSRGAFYNYDLVTHVGTAEAPALIESNDTLSTSADDVGMDGSGRAIVLMRQRDDFGSNSSVLVNRYAGSWGTATALNPSIEATTAALSVNRAGEAMAVWLQCSPCSLWARRFDGATWLPGGRISATTDDTANHPGIALDGVGRAIAVWTSGASAAETVFAANFEPATGWSPLRSFPDDPGITSTDPVLAFGHAGTGIAAWVREEPGATPVRKIQGALYKY